MLESTTVLSDKNLKILSKFVSEKIKTSKLFVIVNVFLWKDYLHSVRTNFYNVYCTVATTIAVVTSTAIHLYVLFLRALRKKPTQYNIEHSHYLLNTTNSNACVRSKPVNAITTNILHFLGVIIGECLLLLQLLVLA